ncbi:MAG: hypothetical protein EAY81_04970 [Bacteroidetes bacterium]|nr:MAG: hypothetical protein EAY81_04970 [Bacteroidota bacterium]
MTNEANIPTEVMDWLHTTPFNHLTPKQQTLVLQYFSQEEYTTMVGLLRDLQQHSHPLSKQRIKSNLLIHFDKKYRANQPYAWISQSIPLWKAAAVLLVLAGVGYFNYTTRLRQLAVVFNRKPDTVYVDRLVQAETVKVIDTVYAEKLARKSYKSMKNSLLKEQSVVLQQMDIKVQSFKNINNLANRTKRNSISDDTLISTYRFITL